MRIVNIVLCLLMLLFIAVQYNDPDGPLWMAIYAIAAIWTAIAAFRRSLLGNRFVHLLLMMCIAAAIAGMLYFWPATPGWWKKEVWWEVESVREGMGMMIVAAVLVVVWFSRPRLTGPVGKRDVSGKN